MQSICQPDARGYCTQCGGPNCRGVLKRCPAGPSPPRRKRSPPVCEWLGQPTESIALIQCQGCCGNVRTKHAVHDCAKHGACVPCNKAGDVMKIRGRIESAMQCSRCEFNPSVNPPHPPNKRGNRD